MRFVVHDSPQAAATAVAALIAEAIDGSAGSFTLGLAGGRTPEAAYRALRGRATRWALVDAWLADERWVAHDSERSNGRMADMTLIGHVEATFHRPEWGELIQPADSAARYEATLRSIHRSRKPDLILLGMGEDGHTASLFPETAALDEEERWVVANEVASLGETRITATYPLLWQAKHLIVLATGENKAEALRDSRGGTTPAGRLGDGDAEVEWHLDTAAASLLS